MTAVGLRALVLPAGGTHTIAVRKNTNKRAAARVNRLIGERMRDRRRELGLSQEDLAVLAGLNWTTLGRIERGEQAPQLETLVRVAAALEIQPGEFINGLTPAHFGGDTPTYSARDFVRERANRQVASTEEI